MIYFPHCPLTIPSMDENPEKQEQEAGAGESAAASEEKEPE